MSEVIVVDLGMGNLRSVARAIERAGGRARLTSSPAEVTSASRLVVPGQGQFRDCATGLAGPLGDAVERFIASERPYLGICLGMQALLSSSEEAPGCSGLSVVPGVVRRFGRELRDPGTGERLKVPLMGWTTVASDLPLLRDWFYFVHSYHCVPDDRSWVAGTAEHGGPFCAAMARGSLLAVQFHPEKSGQAGHRILERFVRDGSSWS